VTRRQFENTVRKVLESMPAEHRAYMDNVVVDVADWPDEELLKRAGLSDEEIAAGETLLGLFDPLLLPTPWADAVDTGAMLHRLWIFQGPHEEAFPDPKQLRIEIKKTLIHELAHHFGYSDRDLEPFDAKEDPFQAHEK
jgi:predicted Zn-dependent protease with MMP-like domain